MTLRRCHGVCLAAYSNVPNRLAGWWRCCRGKWFMSPSSVAQSSCVCVPFRTIGLYHLIMVLVLEYSWGTHCLRRFSLLFVASEKPWRLACLTVAPMLALLCMCSWGSQAAIAMMTVWVLSRCHAAVIAIIHQSFWASRSGFCRLKNSCCCLQCHAGVYDTTQ